MRRLVTTHSALGISLAIVVFYLTGYLVFGRDAAKIVVDNLVVGASLAVSLSWREQAWASIRAGIPDGTANIIVSIWLLSTIMVAYFAYLVVYVSTGSPEWMKALPTSGLFSTFFFLSMGYAFLVPVNTREEIPRPALRRVVISAALGGVLAGGLMAAAYFRIFVVNGAAS